MIEKHFPGPDGPRLYWLLSKPGRAHETFLILGGEPEFGKSLPVFTGKGLAATFLEASGLGEGAWRARRVAGGELISLLCGPCGRVAGVALNPPGESVSAGSGLRADVGRVGFLDQLSGRGRVRAVSGSLGGSLGGSFVTPGPAPGALVGA